MSSRTKVLLTEKDVDVLKLLQKPSTRYKISKHFGNHYPTTCYYIERLEEEGFIFVVESEPWRAGKKGSVKKLYLITARGRAVLRGFEEAERRE